MRLKIARIIMIPAGIVAIIFGIVVPENTSSDMSKSELVAIGVALVLVGVVWNYLHRKKKVVRTFSEPSTDNTKATPNHQQTIDSFPGLAKQHVATLANVSGKEVSLDKKGILEIDSIIKEGWGDEPPALLDQIVLGFGSFLGEAIKSEHGGVWEHREDLGYVLTNIGALDITIFPFDKIRKRFVNGDEDSISFFYEFIKGQIEEKEADFGKK